MDEFDDALDPATPPWVAANLRVLSAIAEFGGATEDRAPLALPHTIGAYELVEKIGAGGMGDVYRARQLRPFRRDVALKLLRADGDARRHHARFESERQTLASLDHDGIARVFDAGVTDEGHPYFAMELVHGVPITAYCDLHRLPIEERLHLFAAVCRAIHHAHQRGVIHRDIKPSNVLVAAENGAATPKVIDFGVAKARESLDAQARQTQAGQVLGTPEYMSPEQIDSPGTVDTRADVYSLGVLLYELLTGFLPFDSRELRSSGFAQLAQTIRESIPPPPSVRVERAESAAEGAARRRGLGARELRRRIRGDLDWIVLCAIDKDPARRYSSASELAADVERHLRFEPVSAGRPGLVDHIAKLARRHRTAFVAAGLLVAALVIGMLATGWQASRALRAEAKARESEAIAQSVNEFLAGVLGAANPEADVRARDLTVGEALDEAAAKLDGAFADQPAVEARIRRTIGEAYTALRRDHAAIHHLERAAELARAQGDARERIEAQKALALAYHHAGRVDDAVAAAREELRIACAMLAPNDSTRLHAEIDCAKIVARAGDLAFADSLFRGAIEKSRASPEVSPATLAVRIHEYASMLDARGSFDEAEAAFRESAATIRAAKGAEHPDAIRAMTNLGDFLRRKGALAEAESVLAKSLESARSTLGPEHPDVGNALMALGATRLDGGDVAGAETLLREAIAILRRGPAGRNPEVALALTHYGTALRSRGELDGATGAFREALEIVRGVYPPEHPEVFRAANNLGSVLLLRGEYAEAERLMREARDAAVSIFGPEHHEVALVTQNLAKTLTGEKKWAEADSTYRIAIEMGLRTLPPGHVALAFMRSNYGELLLKRGRSAQAESLLAPAYEEIAAALGAEHPRAVQTDAWLREARRR